MTVSSDRDAVPADSTSDVGVVIVAAGKGLRLGADLPKQYLPLGRVPILRRTVEAFAGHPRIGPIVVVHGPDQAGICRETLTGMENIHYCVGGATRRASVRGGLEVLGTLVAGDAIALIHDAARPFVSFDVMDRVIDGACAHGAAIPAIAPVDSVKSLGPDGTVGGSVDRDGLRLAQTPQGFRLDLILRAHDETSSEWDASDDAALAESIGVSVQFVDGDGMNDKITHDWQYRAAEARLNGQATFRVGNGFDVHRLGTREDGIEGVFLCGIHIPHSRALIGHSDADVALHALTDAILGAMGLGDIGDHFPPSDPQWKGTPSDLFLTHAANLVREAGAEIMNCDLTILCERPKIAPHRAAMRDNVARLLDLPVARISVKATTTERLGFTGREEGIACQATVSVRVL